MVDVAVCERGSSSWGRLWFVEEVAVRGGGSGSWGR